MLKIFCLGKVFLIAFFAFVPNACSQSYSKQILKDLDAISDTKIDLMPLVVNIYNSEERRLIDNGTIEEICKVGRQMNQKGIPIFNYNGITNIYNIYAREDYSSYGKYAASMKSIVPSIKLSAFIKTVTFACPKVF
jgi:hypothetical protein